ncbi:hypothetical protein [Magnetospirillum sp. ME-1]|uniref:hypothetical protein n=1 Tax=Magnetospirillum sp. ME-1 TaxID=1639348 RepID=UPI0011AE3F8D|nr:hypothetical protein [Magnetospirillum sp. ME-1]
MSIRLVFAATCLLLLAGGHMGSAFGDEKIAQSDRQGISVIATDAGGGWCKPVVNLKVAAKDSKFFTDGVEKLSQALGKTVLPDRCPEAKSFALEGGVGDGSFTSPIYRGSAKAEDGWKIVAAAVSSPPDNHERKKVSRENDGAKLEVSGNKAVTSGEALCSVAMKNFLSRYKGSPLLWNGNCKDGMADGFGVLTNKANTFQYIGGMVGGRPDGAAALKIIDRFDDGDRVSSFKGKWKGGVTVGPVSVFITKGNNSLLIECSGSTKDFDLNGCQNKRIVTAKEQEFLDYIGAIYEGAKGVQKAFEGYMTYVCSKRDCSVAPANSSDREAMGVKYPLSCRKGGLTDVGVSQICTMKCSDRGYSVDLSQRTKDGSWYSSEGLVLSKEYTSYESALSGAKEYLKKMCNN